MTNQEIEIADTRSILSSLLAEACVELFSSYEVALTHQEQLTDSNEANFNLIALIGLSEEFFRASLTICASPKLLKTSFPASEEEISQVDIQDWLGELANQLAGRIKNKVLRYGRKLDLGIPISIQGTHLKVDLPKSSIISKHQFISEHKELVELSLSTLIDDKFILTTPEETNDEEILGEGEMLFF
jgi:CheY-specific phosphatase CheX